MLERGQLSLFAEKAGGPGRRASEPAWPRRFGAVPEVAESFQERTVARDLRSALSGEAGALGAGGADGAPHTLVLVGPGGMGKTQLAAKVARERWDEGSVDLLLWVTADSRKAVVEQYAHAAVAVAGAEPGDPEAAAQEFVAWLAATPRRWLLVLDDVAAPGDLRGLWPPRHASGRTLLTTRRRDAAFSGPGRAPFEVGVFRREEAVAYLAAKLAVHGRREDQFQLTEVADALGDLPIALAQAVAYQIDAGLDSAAYLTRWTDRRRTLADLAPRRSRRPGPGDQQRALAAVGSLSSQHAGELSPQGLAQPLMELAGLLDPHGIPVGVLTSEPALRYLAARRAAGSETAGGPEGDVRPEGVARPEAAVAPKDALNGLHCLRRVSLADLDDGPWGAIVRVHALSQQAVRESLNPDELAQAVLAGADALLAAWPAAGSDPQLTFAFRSNLIHLYGHGEAALWRCGGHPVLLHADLASAP